MWGEKYLMKKQIAAINEGQAMMKDKHLGKTYTSAEDLIKDLL